MSESISLGDTIFIAIKPILKIYCVIAVGYAFVKAKMLSPETSRGISNMVVNGLIPCLTFSKVVSNLNGSQIKDIGVFMLSTVVIFGTGFALSIVILFTTPVPQKWKFGLIFAGIFSNIVDLPIAYVQSMGTGQIFSPKDVDRAVALNCMFLAVLQFLLQNMGCFQIVGLDFKEEKQKDQELDVFVEPPVQDYIPGDSAIERAKIDETIGDTGSQNSSATDDDFDVIPLPPTTSTRSGTRRPSSILSAGSHNFNRVLSHESGYSTRSRPKSHSIQGIIDEYSEAERIRSIPNMESMARTISTSQYIGLKHQDDEEFFKVASRDPTLNNETLSKYRQFINRHRLGWLDFMVVNLGRTPSVVLLLSFFVSMVPWVRALFVHNSIDIKDAPDALPPLNFLIDFTTYIGNAAVPMGLILLGGTLARLEVKEIPKGFWKTVLALVVCRLVIMPVIGVLWANQLYRSGWIEDDVSRFMMAVAWSVPSATAQVYFTAFYSPLEGDHIQMDCLAVVLLAQYPVMVITLPTVVSYVLKVSIGV